jgi:hypothetical protein
LNNAASAPPAVTGKDLAWQPVTGACVSVAISDAGLAMVGRQLDGLWLPIAAPAGRKPMRVGDPCISRHAAQRWAESVLAGGR